MTNFQLLNKTNLTKLIILPPIRLGQLQLRVFNQHGQIELSTNITQNLNDFMTKIVKKRVENEEIIDLNEDVDSDLEEDIQQQPHVFIKTYTDELKPKIEMDPNLIENLPSQKQSMVK